MSNEISLLKLFCESRTEFEKGAPYLEEIKNMEREIKVVFNLISRYYKSYKEHNYIGKEELVHFYDMNYPSSKEREVYVELIFDIFHKQISTDIMQDILEHTIEQHHASQILSKLIPVVEGNKYGVLSSITQDIDQFNAKMRNPPETSRELSPCMLSVKELVAQEIDGVGLSWPLQPLNQVLGTLRSKTLGVIYAFVDSGKTSFGVSCCANFAKQLVGTSSTIVYAGNEEAAPRISLRLTQAFTNKTRRQIQEDPLSVDKERVELGWGRVFLFDSVSHISTVEKILSKLRPRVIFLDQGTKIKTDFAGDNEIYSAQYLFNWYRERAKLYDTNIICLAQATGECENRKYLKLSDIYSSRVAIQGEIDYAIGIGRSIDDLSLSRIRYFNVPKNKLNDGESVRFSTVFNKEYCQFVEA